MTRREGYFTIQDTIGDILETYEGKKLMDGVLVLASQEMHRTINPGMLRMIRNFSVEKLFSFVGSRFPQDMLSMFNALLQQIRKPNFTSMETASEDDLNTDDAFFSVQDRIEEICRNTEAKKMLLEFAEPFTKGFGVSKLEKYLPLVYGFMPKQLLKAGESALPDDAGEKLQAALQTIHKI